MLIVPSPQGYGAISPSSPGFDEQAFFDEIIDQPLVAAAPGEKATVKQRKSWESAMSSTRTQRFVSILHLRYLGKRPLDDSVRPRLIWENAVA